MRWKIHCSTVASVKWGSQYMVAKAYLGLLHWFISSRTLLQVTDVYKYAGKWPHGKVNLASLSHLATQPRQKKGCNRSVKITIVFIHFLTTQDVGQSVKKKKNAWAGAHKWLFMKLYGSHGQLSSPPSSVQKYFIWSYSHPGGTKKDKDLGHLGGSVR